MSNGKYALCRVVLLQSKSLSKQ
ncbi:hypothetical protein [Enterobacter sichuanensis]